MRKCGLLRVQRQNPYDLNNFNSIRSSDPEPFFMSVLTDKKRNETDKRLLTLFRCLGDFLMFLTVHCYFIFLNKIQLHCYRFI